MKLFDLLKVMEDYNGFDLADIDFDISLYYQSLSNEKMLKSIEVKKINNHYIICDFTSWIKNNLTSIKKYVVSNYRKEYIEIYKEILKEYKSGAYSLDDLIEYIYENRIIEDMLDEELKA